MKVSQDMTRPVETVGPDTEFHQAFDLMRSRRIHHLPVVEGDRVIGMIASAVAGACAWQFAGR